jgi:hypothetical protein
LWNKKEENRKSEGKDRPTIGYKGPEGEYSSTLSLTSAVDAGERLTPLPGRFTP